MITPVKHFHNVAGSIFGLGSSMCYQLSGAFIASFVVAQKIHPVVSVIAGGIVSFGCSAVNHGAFILTGKDMCKVDVKLSMNTSATIGSIVSLLASRPILKKLECSDEFATAASLISCAATLIGLYVSNKLAHKIEQSETNPSNKANAETIEAQV